MGAATNRAATSSALLTHQNPHSRLVPLVLSLSPMSSKQRTKVWPSNIRGPGEKVHEKRHPGLLYPGEVLGDAEREGG